LVLGGAILLGLPANFFDNGPAMCLSVLFFDQECYACGMTRACQHIIHFQFPEAWAFNPLAFAAMPFMGYGYFNELYANSRIIRRYYQIESVKGKKNSSDTV